MTKRSLEDVLKDKFSGQELPDSSGTWEKIQKKLNVSEAENKTHYWLAAAALSGILFFVCLYFINKDLQPSSTFSNHSPAKLKQAKPSTPIHKIQQEEKLVVINTDTKEEKKSDKPSIKFSTLLIKGTSAYEEQILPDSSIVAMNSISSLSYTQDDRIGRIVKLEGNAFFHVKNKNGLPFKIYAGKSYIEVVGTSFNVMEYTKDSIALIVEEGKVKFGNRKNEDDFIYLIAGEKGIFAGERVFKVNTYNKNELAWKTGIISFNKTKISEALLTLEDYFHVKIRVSDPGVLNCHVTGKFKQPELVKVLDLFSTLIKIKYEKQQEGYMLVGKGCD